MRNDSMTQFSFRGRRLVLTLAVAVGSGLFGWPGVAAAQTGDDEVSALYQRSYDREALGDYESALGALEALPRAERGSFIYQLRRGWLFYLLGRYEASIGAYEEAIATAPEALEARLGLMLPQMAARRWQDAEETGRAILALDPMNYLARRRLALALYNLGRYPEAEALYREVLAQYPADVEVLSGVAWSVYRQGDEAEALRLFRDVLHYSQNNASALEGLRTIGEE